MSEVTVILNGEKNHLPKSCSLLEALKNWADEKTTFAIAVNEQFIPRSLYAEVTLNEGDRIELLSPMQGG